MQGKHSHGDTYYRCRFPQEYRPLANRLEHSRKVYLREEALIDPLDRWLLQAFSPARRDHTIAHLAEQAATDLPAAAMPEIETSISAGYDAKLDRNRAALEAGADPAVVAGRIAETQAARRRALDQLIKTTPTGFGSCPRGDTNQNPTRATTVRRHMPVLSRCCRTRPASPYRQDQNDVAEPQA
jgi:site-specific DNA recombinase